MGFASNIKTLACAAALVAMSAVASTAATFTGSFNLSGSALSEPGLVVSTNPSSGSFSFNLNPGQSTTFDLFDIWTDETWAPGGNSVAQTLLASFALSQPNTSTGALSGTTNGNGTFLQYGSINWSGPLLLNFSNSGVLSIALSNELFNFGLFGLGAGAANGATIQATATYQVAPVPLPAAGLGLVAALGALGFVRRKARRA